MTVEASFREANLGRTGLRVGRLGLAASYGAPAAAFEAAFERGCNYFYIGSGRRRAAMRRAVAALCRRGLRDRIVVAVQTYARWGFLAAPVFARRLRAMGLDRADVLVLGWHNRPPSRRLIDAAARLREKGLCRFLALSGHNRSLFPRLAAEGVFDLFHVRYNAAHRGAETEVFPALRGEDRPGLVSYTATRWGHLLDAKKMPAGETPLAATDCYRFVLTRPEVDVCLCGPKNMAQMQTALAALEGGPLSADEMARARRIGDHVRARGGFFI